MSPPARSCIHHPPAFRHSIIPSFHHSAARRAAILLVIIFVLLGSALFWVQYQRQRNAAALQPVIQEMREKMQRQVDETREAAEKYRREAEAEAARKAKGQ